MTNIGNVITSGTLRIANPTSLVRKRGWLVMAALLPFVLPTSAGAQSLGYAEPSQTYWSEERALPTPQATEDGDSAVVPDRFKRRIVSLNTREPAGTVIVDTGNTYLYYVLGQGRAIRYGVGVGREGFTWAGVQTVSRKAEWPDWHPPVEMIARQPYLPRFMAGGPGNPLGAAAMYLGSSTYRIHGTNDPSTIGKFVSSGCIRLTNEDVQDLASRVTIGARVVVLPKGGSPMQANGVKALPQRAANKSPPETIKVSNIKVSGLY